MKDGRSGTSGKKFANRTVRRNKGDIPNGKAYQKYFESYDIHDYISMETKTENKSRYESGLRAYLNGGLPINSRVDYTKKYDENNWAKSYYRK